MLGLAGAAVMRRALENQIYGVHPLDPSVLCAAESWATVALSGMSMACPSGHNN